MRDPVRDPVSAPHAADTDKVDLGGSQEACKGGMDAKGLSPWIDSQPVEGRRRAQRAYCHTFSAAITLWTVAKQGESVLYLKEGTENWSCELD